MNKVIITLIFIFNGLILFSQKEYYYCDSIISFTYNTNDDSTCIEKSFSYYNVHGEIIYSEKYIDGIESSRSEYLYDSDSVLLNKIDYTWNNQWIYTTKENYNYNSQGRMILVIHYNWKDSNWIENYRSECIYEKVDGEVFLTSINIYKDGSISSTENYTYDSDGNLIKKTVVWQGTLVYTEELTYNSDGYITESVWHAGRRGEKYEYHYDSNKYLAKRIVYEWDSDLQEFLLSNKEFYYYAGYYTSTEIMNLCEGDSILWENKYYNAEGKYSKKFTSLINRDSIRVLKLFLLPSYHYFESDTICEGDSLVWHDRVLSSEGNHYANYSTYFSCDSSFEVALTIISNPANFTITGLNQAEEFQNVMYSVPENSEVTYRWFIENGNTSNYPSANTCEIQWGITGIGRIECIAENLNGCTSDTSLLEVSIGSLGIKTQRPDNISVYPNPVNKGSDIIIDCPFFESVNVLTITGQIVETYTSQNIPTSNLTTGMYFLNVRDSDQNVSLTKVIVK